MLIDVKRGLDVPIGGRPEQRICPGPDPARVALLGLDYTDLRPSVRVQPGQRVAAGETLFVDRADSRVCYTAPGTGRIVEINRGARRSLVSIVIELEADDAAARVELPGGEPAALSRKQICTTLLAAGLWPALRARPYGRVANPDGLPVALFVTAMDTNPLAADPRVVIAERADDFADGLAALARLAPATYLCTAPDAGLPCPSEEGLRAVQFAGKHPAGLAGTHMRYLQHEPGEVWQVGYQDVLAIGLLFRTGRVSNERVIALAGPGVGRPRLIRTRLGADLQTLLAGEIEPACRVIAGSVLSGRALTPVSGYLGRYQNQVTVLRDVAIDSAGGAPGNAFWRALFPRAGWGSAGILTAAAHGAPDGMLPVEDFDRVWPYAVPPAPLLRALLLRDTETASALGCLALVEEDLALCSYVCPGKLDYGEALRDTLREIERGR